MNAPYRRGACPGLSAPMQTGDGLLARLIPAGDTISLDAFAGLCAAAQTHGNGIVEVTARGSIQVRGLTPGSSPAFAAAVTALGIAGMDGTPVLANPLSGLDAGEAMDAAALAAELRRALAATPFAGRLGPKVSVVVDGGGALHLDALAADLRLRAETSPQGLHVHVGIGGDAGSAALIGAVVAPHAVDAALRLLGVIAARGAHVRARDIRAAEFRAAIADRLIDAAPPPARAAAQPLGLHPLRDGSSALGLALAFGHADAATLTALVAAAREAGAQGLRTAPGRALLLVGLALEQAPALAAAAEKLGFVVRADDPSRHIAACAGAPVCASAAIPTRTLAPLLFDALAPLLDGSLVVHLSGCSKGCAHARAAALTIVGTPDACAVTLDGLARDTPSAFISADTLPSRLADLGQAVARQRRPGDSAADALRRLGAPGVVAVLQDPEA